MLKLRNSQRGSRAASFSHSGTGGVTSSRHPCLGTCIHRLPPGPARRPSSQAYGSTVCQTARSPSRSTGSDLLGATNGDAPLRPVEISGLDKPTPRLPSIDWQRFHVQVLFVDHTDTVRARVAAGLAETISEWNGYGRAILPWTCGVASANLARETSSAATASSTVVPSDEARMARTVAAMSGAAQLGLELRPFARGRELFELADLDMYDLTVALDRSVRDSIIEQIDPSLRDMYSDRIVLLSQFSTNAPDAVLLAEGGTALLPSRLSAVLRGAPSGLAVERGAVDIASPLLSSVQGPAMWERMVRTTLLGTAGLIKHLMDEYPPGLHWEPLE